MINREYYSLMTNYGTNLINSLVLPGTTSFIANGWYIELGDGIQDITPETTSLANTIYGKDSDNYVGITFGNDSIYGRYAKLEIPSTVQGVIREAGLFDGDDNLICVAKCLIDLSSTEQIGMLYDASIQLYVKAIPSDVEIVYINPSNVPTKDYVEAAIASAVAGLDQFEEKSKKGVANGYAGLDSTGKVPTSQLPELGSTVVITNNTVSPATTDDLENIKLYTQSGFENVSSIQDNELNFVRYTFTNVDLTSYETVTTSSNLVYQKDGLFVSDSTASTLAITINGVTRNIPALAFPIKAGTHFTSSVSGKFYYFEGQ